MAWRKSPQEWSAVSKAGCRLTHVPNDAKCLATPLPKGVTVNGGSHPLRLKPSSRRRRSTTLASESIEPAWERAFAAVMTGFRFAISTT